MNYLSTGAGFLPSTVCIKLNLSIFFRTIQILAWKNWLWLMWDAMKICQSSNIQALEVYHWQDYHGFLTHINPNKTWQLERWFQWDSCKKTPTIFFTVLSPPIWKRFGPDRIKSMGVRSWSNSWNISYLEVHQVGWSRRLRILPANIVILPWFISFLKLQQQHQQQEERQ